MENVFYLFLIDRFSLSKIVFFVTFLVDLVRPPVDCPLESVQRLIEYAHFIAAHYTISKDNLEHFLLVCFTNAHYTPNTHTGSSVAGLFVRASMMNHSCSPNTIFRFTYIQQHGKDSDGNILSNSPCNVEIVFTAVRDLAEGAFLSCSYLNELELLLPTAMRRKRLQAVKFFQCQCERYVSFAIDIRISYKIVHFLFDRLYSKYLFLYFLLLWF